MKLYPIEGELSIPEEAPAKYADLSLSEIRKGDSRTIGGDRGDLSFEGYTVEGGKSVLCWPVLATTQTDLTPEEAKEIAEEILMASYESIGVESITHS